MNVVIRNSQQLAQAKEDLELLKKAWRKILVGGQELEMENTNRIKRADLKEITEQITAYETAIDSYERHGKSRGAMRQVIPFD